MSGKIESFNCVPIKTVCFVLAIINAVGNALLLICCAGAGLLWYIDNDLHFSDHHTSLGIKIGGVRFKRELFPDMITHGQRSGPESTDPWRPWHYWLPILTVASLLSFIFSVLLCVGISKCRPRLVKAYFVYGSVLTVLAILASVIQLYPMLHTKLGLWSIFGCVLHLLFLVLVYLTHGKLQKEAMFGSHVLREETGDTQI